MNTRLTPSGQKLSKDISRMIWGMAIVWSLVIAGLITISIWQHRQAVRHTAIAQARTHFQKDVAFRLWAAHHGGVYVPTTEQTPSNPYLDHIPERDIVTPSGKKLTLMNPAYITRQIFEKSGELWGIHEHIASLQPLNPINTPDAWEQKAFKAFQDGKTEVLEFYDYNGAPHLRLMQPVVAEEPCLKCHTQQGYRLGDVRGGISISLPMAGLLANELKGNITASLSLGILWLLGLGGLLFGRQALLRQVREQHQATIRLQQTLALLQEERALFVSGPVVVFKWLNRENWPVEYTSSNVEDILGYTVDDFIQGRVFYADLIHPLDKARVGAEVADYSQGGTKRIEHQPYRLLHKNGNILWVLDYTTIHRDANDVITHYLGYLIDISTWRKAEEALQESEERLSMTLRGANLGTWDWNIATGEILINDRWAEMLDYRKDEIEPHVSSWEKLIHPDDLPAARAALTDHLEGRTIFFEAEYRILAKSGIWKWIHDAGQVVSYDPAGRPIRATGIHCDISKSRELEQRVLQQERLSAVGQLAAGIAHDFNNTLTSILGFAELLRKNKEIPEPAPEYLSIIVSSSERAALLVRQMLDFSRQSVRSPKRLDLAPFCKEIVKFLQSAIPETIHLHCDIDPGDYLVQADPTQIQSLLTNLALNAKDAMADTGGELRIKLSRNHLTAGTRCALCNQPLAGEWIEITIADSGSGMTPETLSRIFEPFFTTKETGKGSGLGLSQVLGIAEQHGGHVTVASQPGRGTTFTIYLPPVMLDQLPEEPRPAVPIPHGQGNTILLVEDDPTVSAAIQTMLQHLDYQVLTAANGREALECYSSSQTPIALVLSDMVMPELDGQALFTALKLLDPAVRVILMSGYHPGENKEELLRQGVADWLHKPISLEPLAQALWKEVGRSK